MEDKCISWKIPINLGTNRERRGERISLTVLNVSSSYLALGVEVDANELALKKGGGGGGGVGGGMKHVMHR